MGAAVSVNHLVNDMTEEQVVDYFLTKYEYYKANSSVSQEEVEPVEKAWKLILENQVPRFFRRKERNEITQDNSLLWFYDSFYKIAFSVDGESMELVGLKVQIEQFSAMITQLIQLFKDGNIAGVEKAMGRIAKSHFKMGIKASQYGEACKLLILTQKHCLGEVWNDGLMDVWSRITSIMLGFLIPKGIHFELRHTSEDVNIDDL